jgi:hypothetical protein
MSSGRLNPLQEVVTLFFATRHRYFLARSASSKRDVELEATQLIV